MYARALTWWTILRICLEERLVYRGDFALGTLMRFLPIVTQVFLWGSVFAAAGKTTIAGYTKDEMIAYYLLTMVSRAFSSMPGLASGIARQIRDGEIKKFLIQPIDMLGFLLLSRVAHKLVYYVVATGPFALVFFLCRELFRRLARCRDHGGVSGLAGADVPAGVLPGSADRHDRLLVSGSQLAIVRLYAVQFFLFRTHVSDRYAAGRVAVDRAN